MDSSTFRSAAHRAVDYIADYYDHVAELPVRSDVSPGYLVDRLPRAAPETSEEWSCIEADIHNLIEPGLCHWTHPGFMAYFPASSTFEGILGEMYSAAFNNPAFDWVCSPAITELELAMVDWVAELLHLPEAFRSGQDKSGGGVIMGSTTECLITTMCSARDKVLAGATSKEDLRSKLVVISGSETHMSTKKAANVIGVRHHSVHCDPSDGVGLTGSQLQAAVDECLANGLVPFYVTVNFGTTNSCAVDDFRTIAQVKERHPEIWIHVDAAYAGAALACEEFRSLADGMEEFDSFSVNMGKWLLTNLDCTMLLARQQSNITDSMKNSCTIVENDVSRARITTDFRNLQLSMGRRFRSLKIWFVLRSWGQEGIRRNIRHHIEIAAAFTDWIQLRPDLFSFATKPQFALNAIRVSDEAADRLGIDVDSATLKLYHVINARKDMWVSKTAINGCTAIRTLAANPKSDVESLRFVFDSLVESLESLLKTPDKLARSNFIHSSN